MHRKKNFYFLVNFFILLPFLYNIFFEWHYNWIGGAVILLISIAGVSITIIVSYFSFKEYKSPNILLLYTIVLCFICILISDRLATKLYFSLNEVNLTEIVDIFHNNPGLKNFSVTHNYRITYNDEELKYSSLKSDSLDVYLAERHIDSKEFIKLTNLTEKLDMLSISKKDEGDLVFLNDGFINGSEGILYSTKPEDFKRTYLYKFSLFKIKENWYRYHSK